MVERKHGVVFTKRWVVDMVLDLVGYTPGTGLANKIIIEPACGSGAFLTAIAERLADEISPSGDWCRLAHAVVAFDIDATSLELCKNATIQALVSKGCPPNMAQSLVLGWLRNQDFILADAPVADFVVGNPPYVRASDMDRELRKTYCTLLESMTHGCDLYVGFFEKGLKILRSGGQLGFICADRWLQNSYGRRLRHLVGASYALEVLVRMHGVDAFEDAVDAYPAITLIRNSQEQAKVRFVNCAPQFCKSDVTAVAAWLAQPAIDLASEHFEAFEIARPEGDGVYPLGNSELVRFVTQACKQLPSLKSAGIKLGIGIATGCDDVFLTEDENLVEPAHLLPIFYMRDHRQGCGNRRRWLVNPWDKNGQLTNLEDKPRLKAYFEKHRDSLQSRYVAKKHPLAWYRTIDKVIPELMDRELLLMPDMATQPDPILAQGFYPHHNCYWIYSDKWDLRVLGGLLMADTTRRFVDVLGVKMRGGTLRFQAQYLQLVHLPYFEDLTEDMRNGLRKAFVEKDRAAATYFAEQAYAEAMTGPKGHK